MLVIALTLGSAVPRAFAQCHYTWQQIPNPGSGQFCTGTCLNNFGVVAGYISTSGDTETAFVWSPETGRTNLPFPPGYISMRATGINDSGVVVGPMWGPAGWAGFVWDGQQHMIITLPPWANMIEVNAINNGDEVVGMIVNSGTGPMHAFVWSKGVLTDLGSPSGTAESRATNIHDDGTIVGTAYDGPPARGRAWMIRDDMFEWLDTPAGLFSANVRGVNALGFVVGEATALHPIRYQGVIWTSWQTYLIPAPDQFQQTRLTGINDAGRAVGYYQTSDRAIVWQAGLVRELAPLCVPEVPVLRQAFAINRNGQIVAHEGGRTYLLSPHWSSSDLSGDCETGLQDLALLLSSFGTAGPPFVQGDIDGNGRVDLFDLSIVLANFGH